MVFKNHRGLADTTSQFRVMSYKSDKNVKVRHANVVQNYLLIYTMLFEVTAVEPTLPPDQGRDADWFSDRI